MRYTRNITVNLTNLAVPSLIANDLVIVHPMTSYSGSVAYLEYTSKTDKGDVKKGDLFNGVFGLGTMSEARQNFTSQVIVETLTGTAKPILTPMSTKRFNDGKADIKLVKKADGTVVYGTVDATSHEITWDGSYAPVEGDKIAYFSEEFQMEHVPAQDIPTIGPVMKHIPLVAEPRRIAVRYDQITAFQA